MVSEKNLCTIFELHDRLLDISERINDFYSTNAVIFVTVSFIALMFGIVFVTKEIFYHFKGENNMSIMAASYIVWSIPNISLIFLLLHTCETTRNMAYDTSLCVHKIIQKRPIFMVESDIFYSKMKAFSLQLLHRKRTFNFNGQGLFNFDYTFIFSVSLRRFFLFLFDLIHFYGFCFYVKGGQRCNELPNCAITI